MSAFIKNKDGLTAKELAEKNSKQKFHRVIRNLKKYEDIETAKIKAKSVKKIKKVIVYE